MLDYGAKQRDQDWHSAGMISAAVADEADGDPDRDVTPPIQLLNK